MVHTRSAIPAAIAGVAPLSVLCFRQKLYQAKCSASAALRLSHFLENPLVRRVSLRMHIRIRQFLPFDVLVQIQ